MSGDNMFWKRITLFRLLGFAVRIDASWIVIALLVTWSLAAGLFPEQYPDLPPGIYCSSLDSASHPLSE